MVQDFLLQQYLQECFQGTVEFGIFGRFLDLSVFASLGESTLQGSRSRCGVSDFLCALRYICEVL